MFNNMLITHWFCYYHTTRM